MLRHAPVGFAQHRIVDQRLQHGGFEIIGHEPVGDAAPALKSPAMEADPGGNLLIKYELGILMAAVGQSSHKGIGCPRATCYRIVQGTDRAKVDLNLLARSGVYPDEDLRLCRTDAGHVAADSRVAATEPMVIPQPVKDSSHLNALVEKHVHDLRIRFDG